MTSTKVLVGYTPLFAPSLRIPPRRKRFSGMSCRRDLILIGASRGGVDALRRLVDELPADLPAAVLIVLHTASDGPVATADIIGRRSALPVDYAEQGSRIEPGRICLAPPGSDAVVAGVVLTAGDHDGPEGLPAIKRAGGVRVVQRPRDAVDPDVPMSAICGGSPDHVVPPGEMSRLPTRLAGSGGASSR